MKSLIKKFTPLKFRKLLINKPVYFYAGQIEFLSPVYLIRRNNEISGLYSNIIYFLKHIHFARSKGWLCSIDMLTQHSLIYHEKDELGKINVFENYYKQPDNISVIEALNCTKMVLPIDLNFAFDISLKRLKNNPKECVKWSKILIENFKPNEEALCFFDDLIPNVDMQEAIGVAYRYGYVQIKPFGHPIQPDLDDLISLVRISLLKEGFKYIFLSTDDAVVVRRFENEFGGMVVRIKRRLVDSENAVEALGDNEEILNYRSHRQWKGEDIDFSPEKTQDMVKFNRPRDKYFKGIEYMAEIETLSKCGGLICSEANGSLYAYIKGWKTMRYIYFYDLGKYE